MMEAWTQEAKLVSYRAVQNQTEIIAACVHIVSNTADVTENLLGNWVLS